jgi:Cu(I)/Ag(I) efflux system membrane protein CusA/SilA
VLPAGVAYKFAGNYEQQLRATKRLSIVIPISLILIFLLFVNLGLAFWLGDIFGRMYLGFLTVAAFYLLLGLISHIFMRGWLKKVATDYFLKRIFR